MHHLFKMKSMWGNANAGTIGTGSLVGFFGKFSITIHFPSMTM